MSLLKKAYARWHETRGGSVDDWMALIDNNIQFGSLAQNAPQMAFAAAALKSYFRSSCGMGNDPFTMNEFVSEGDVVVVRGGRRARAF